jgi:hypothetical protein
VRKCVDVAEDNDNDDDDDDNSNNNNNNNNSTISTIVSLVLPLLCPVNLTALFGCKIF